MNDNSTALQQQILTAYKTKEALCIQGANSKAFLGNPAQGERLTTTEHTGILSYDASELVITARSGTTLNEIKAALAEHNQMLAFEPATFSDAATLGGTVACNLSGPARAYYGAARDFVLGTKIINGKADIMQFGGQVMKNVAGYDASRLMTGAYGTLGLLLEVSLKVLPKPPAEITLQAELDAHDAIETINRLSGQNLPISASAYCDNQLYIRFSSSEKNTLAASQHVARQLNASTITDSAEFWMKIREQQHDFFDSPAPLWRLSVPATCTNLSLPGSQFIEWGGSLRWLKSNAEPEQIRDTALAVGGHATAYKNIDHRDEHFQPLDKGLKLLHQRLKQAFDPAGIFNPGRLYKDL